MIETEWVDVSIDTRYIVTVDVGFFKQFGDLNYCTRHVPSEDCMCWTPIDDAIDDVVSKIVGFLDYTTPCPACPAWTFVMDASKWGTEWDCRMNVIDIMCGAIRRYTAGRVRYDKGGNDE